tara:strand:- start:302 stop:577 length:276 start_codon:yes stop_codon:yes gene_type:complete
MYNTISFNKHEVVIMAQVKPMRDTSNVDPYTGELFENFEGVGTDCDHAELVELAEEFMEVMARHFTGISVDYDENDYADYFISKYKMDWEV